MLHDPVYERTIFQPTKTNAYQNCRHSIWDQTHQRPAAVHHILCSLHYIFIVCFLFLFSLSCFIRRLMFGLPSFIVRFYVIAAFVLATMLPPRAQLQYCIFGCYIRHTDARHGCVLHHHGKSTLGKSINRRTHSTSNWINKSQEKGLWSAV